MASGPNPASCAGWWRGTSASPKTSSTKTRGPSSSSTATRGRTAYTLVAPKEHREQVTGDFTLEEYLSLQRLVYLVTEAVREEVGAERMYIFTFGSNEGNSHVHWHVVPLPPGVPYEEQQGTWTSWSRGVLEIPRQETASLADRIGARLR